MHRAPIAVYAAELNRRAAKAAACPKSGRRRRRRRRAAIPGSRDQAASAGSESP
ncbi:hypothetical protein SFOMI_3161 [Sphingobium fuliginis]|uniref:Uncharacterized protein n=1 Tax=Sphingobium fuliginis (strain ATCC 27551) TaxID=336203 RepID=A0A292ZD26_SPHSA|nr:hypothetical protein SFOMI_3161 [Sphingobium fuliginis]